MMQRVIFHIHNLARGGAERVVVTLAEKFATEGVETIIVTEEIAPAEYAVSNLVKRVNASEDAHSDEHTGLIGRMRNLKKRQQDLRRILLAEKPDVVIAFDRSANYRAVAAAKGICPVIVSVRNDPTQYYAGRAQQYFCKKYMYKADGCVFQTQQAKEFFPKKFQEKSCIIMNPLNDKYRDVQLVSTRRREIVASGRITREKNHALLIEAFAKLLQDEAFSDVCLKLYGADSGDGSYEKVVEKIEEHQIAEKVAFMGNVTDLERVLPGAGVYVMSSDHEGMPNALMEAMAMGLPCISTDCPCGGPQMLIESGVNGVLVPVGDAQALADAMGKVLSDASVGDRISNNAKLIWNKANVELVYNEWKKYVEQVRHTSET